MKMKSIATLFSMLVIATSSVFAIPASAAPEQDSIVGMPVTPQYSHAENVRSSLGINGGTASCASEGSGQSHVVSMNCMQYLEKKDLFGNYSIVVNAWFDTAACNYLYMTNKEYNVDKGTYQVRGVFTFYAVGGYEEVTAYSHEVKYS